MHTLARLLTILVVIVVTATALGATDASAAPPAPITTPGAGIGHDQQVRDYWTAARVRNAVPMEYSIDARGQAARSGVQPSPQKRPTKTPTLTPPSPTVTPTIKPTTTPSVTPTATPTATTGSLWPDNTQGVASATGKVYFTLGRTDYVCSGTVVAETAADRAVVLSAGHCIYDEGANAFATNWMFIPDYDSGQAFFTANGGCSAFPGLCWVADALVAPKAWADGTASSPNFASDFAYAVFTTPSEVSSAIRSYALQTGATPASSVAAFGYPAAAPYDGTQLVYCAGTTIYDPYQSPATATNWGIACNMTGGSSGGGWLRNFSDPDDMSGAQIVSLNSYKYTAGPYTGYMFGPLLTSQAVTALSVATSLSAPSGGIATQLVP
jgi:hypothetical protein